MRTSVGDVAIILDCVEYEGNYHYRPVFIHRGGLLPGVVKTASV